MSILAIRGHKQRGKEVIEILEMLGGINEARYDGNLESAGYFTGKKIINLDYDIKEAYTLEQFLEKFPYKVGDKVIYNNKTMTITKMVWEETTNIVAYKLDDKLYCNAIEELQPCTEQKLSLEDTGYCSMPTVSPMYKLKVEKQTNNFVEWYLPEGCEFQDEAGNVINTSIVKLVKKKPQYPKTYEECCKVLDIRDHKNYTQGYKCRLISKLQELLICRDAYWKIAGEQMQLGKKWEPIFDKENTIYCIDNYCGEICKVGESYQNKVLAFPTEEMRDAFYENFKELIDECKKLL